MVWYSESARWILLRPTPTPAGDKPPRYRIPAVAGTTRPVGATGTHGCDGRNLSRIGVRDMLSYQSLMPAAAGTPSYENGTWSLEVFGCGWRHPSPLDSGFRRNDGTGDWWDSEALSKPSNTIFVPMTGPPVGIRHCGHNRSRLSQIRARDVLSQCCCTEALQGRKAPAAG